jgi:hypothetical protein
MTLYIAPIVEGHTEAGCVERLLQRIWTELLAAPLRLQVLLPSRCQRDALLKPTGTELSTKIEEANAKLAQRLRRDQQGRGLLLLLLDAERDCPAELAPRLLAAAQAVRSDIDITCILAKSMLENWIVAGASTLAGVNGLPDPLPTRGNPKMAVGPTGLKNNSESRTQHGSTRRRSMRRFSFARWHFRSPEPTHRHSTSSVANSKPGFRRLRHPNHQLSPICQPSNLPLPPLPMLPVGQPSLWRRRASC